MSRKRLKSGDQDGPAFLFGTICLRPVIRTPMRRGCTAVCGCTEVVTAIRGRVRESDNGSRRYFCQILVNTVAFLFFVEIPPFSNLISP